MVGAASEYLAQHCPSAGDKAKFARQLGPARARVCLGPKPGCACQASPGARQADSKAAGSAASSAGGPRASMADVVRHPALIIARNIEWGTVIFGFEQANKYTIYDQDGNVVALLAEDLGGFGRAVGRQALRTRRPLTATVFSPDGSQVIFRVRRPFYLINSTIFVEDGAGNVIGEVKQRWHLWQRNYDLYRAKRQFAYVNGSFLAWEFVLRDEQGGVLALIDRNFQGFGKEIFTDAGKYVIHFGDRAKQAAEQVANTIAAAHPDKPRPPVTALAKFREDIVVVPTQSGDQLEVARPLEIDERSMALAAAISIDYDYFSQHSHGGGWLNPIFMPMPVPSYPPAEPPEGAAGAEVPPEAAPGTPSPAGEAGAPDAPPGSFGQEPGGFGQQPLERELGSDEGFQPPPEDSGWDKQGGEGFEGEELGEWGGGGDSGGGDGGGLWDVAKQLLGIED
ncbi:hypothetical protein WJX72_011575 [[Myrmecia] bisecta]|uniref:Phospholipid scramblase n=1 Tax=[Myrmecia] bisecta TaxID=41462 RepID=A0AAW1Q0V0_9CHLO